MASDMYPYPAFQSYLHLKSAVEETNALSQLAGTRVLVQIVIDRFLELRAQATEQIEDIRSQISNESDETMVLGLNTLINRIEVLDGTIDRSLGSLELRMALWEAEWLANEISLEPANESSLERANDISLERLMDFLDSLEIQISGQESQVDESLPGCSICLDEERVDRMVRLPCHHTHVFHRECLIVST